MKQKCDVCNTDENIAGVFCSGLGAISFCYCQICAVMYAEPKNYVMSDDYYKDSVVYFEDDQYKLNDKVIDIVLKDGRKFNKRSDYFKNGIA